MGAKYAIEAVGRAAALRPSSKTAWRNSAATTSIKGENGACSTSLKPMEKRPRELKSSDARFYSIKDK